MGAAIGRFELFLSNNAFFLLLLCLAAAAAAAFCVRKKNEIRKTLSPPLQKNLLARRPHASVPLPYNFQKKKKKEFLLLNKNDDFVVVFGLLFVW